MSTKNAPSPGTDRSARLLLPDGWCVLLAMLPALMAFGWLIYRLHFVWQERPDMNFGWIVALLCGYLVWEKWEKRPEVTCRPRPVSLVCVLLSLAILFLVQLMIAATGTSSSILFLQAAATLLMCAGCLTFAFGWRGVGAFGFACAFILLALPLPSAVQNLITGNLQSFVASFNTEALGVLGIPAQRVGSLIHLPAGTVGVDEACSGIRSIQSTVMATLFIGYLTLRRVSLQILLLAAGVGLAICGNLIRSLYLSLMANARGIDSIGEVHDAAGWSVLAFTAVGVIILSLLFKKLERAVDLQESAAGYPDNAGVTEPPPP